jgi:hypothetical protein
MTTNEDVFTLDGEAWQVRINGEVLPTTWNSKGAALAGFHVECRRRGIHVLTQDCWCGPEVVKP